MRSKTKGLESNITYTTTDRVCHTYRVNIHCMCVSELKDMFTLAGNLIYYVLSVDQNLVHTCIICPRIKSGNVCRLFLYLRKLFCTRTVSVFCRPEWKIADKVSMSGRARVHSHLLQCVVSLFAEVEQLRRGRKKAFLLLLRICSAMRIYGMCVCTLQNP